MHGPHLVRRARTPRAAHFVLLNTTVSHYGTVADHPLVSCDSKSSAENGGWGRPIVGLLELLDAIAPNLYPQLVASIGRSRELWATIGSK